MTDPAHCCQPSGSPMSLFAHTNISLHYGGARLHSQREKQCNCCCWCPSWLISVARAIFNPMLILLCQLQLGDFSTCWLSTAATIPLQWHSIANNCGYPVKVSKMTGVSAWLKQTVSAQRKKDTNGTFSLLSMMKVHTLCDIGHSETEQQWWFTHNKVCHVGLSNLMACAWNVTLSVVSTLQRISEVVTCG